MKRGLCLSMIFGLLLFSGPALSYTAKVGSVGWFNHWTEGDQVVFSDDYNGSSLNASLYDHLETASNMSLDGNSHLVMIQNPHQTPFRNTAVYMKNSLDTIEKAAFIVNWRNGIPDLGYSYSMSIANFSESDHVDIEIGNIAGYGAIIAFFDENNNGKDSFTPIYMQPIGSDGFTSIGLKMVISSAGVVTPYYWLNSPDGILLGNNANWTPLGTGTSQLDNQSAYRVFFETGVGDATPVPEPATMLLLGLGLTGIAGLRKKFKRT
jgi:hypothetical protein